MRFQLLLLLWLLSLAGCSKQLENVERKQSEVREELDHLGKPMISQTTPEFGYMTIPKFSRSKNKDDDSDTASYWVQIDLGDMKPIDQIVLIPAQMDWQVVLRPNYNFPKRFKVEISGDHGFESDVTVVGAYLNEDCPNPGITPVVFPAHKKMAQYVRLTVVNADAFALAELMVMQGNLNIALGRDLRANAWAIAAPRWQPKNLVDGRTPLGPPIVDEDHYYDGVYAGPPETDVPVSMQLDLGREISMEEVRLYPIHGRHGLDLPGYEFPSKFRIEVAKEPEFSAPSLLFESIDFPNPGNNVITIPARNITARYLRITLLEYDVPLADRRFGLSEIAVYSNNENVALNASLESTEDPQAIRKGWPKNILGDGYTSFGRIVELPEWLRIWTRRRDLNFELEQLNGQQVALLAATTRRQWILSGMLGTLFVVGITGVVLHTRRQRKRDGDQFRRELAHDLHDEIGSNLAAIGIISESGVRGGGGGVAVEMCKEINSIARETTEAMRETLWLAGFKDKIGINLIQELKTTAARILTGKSVQWANEVETMPDGVSMEDRRQIFLFFKETLANIVRHSHANTVQITARLDSAFFVLEIRDNGRGFETNTWSGGTGLVSLRSRAERLGGTVQIETAPENGTRVILKTRVKQRR